MPRSLIVLTLALAMSTARAQQPQQEEKRPALPEGSTALRDLPYVKGGHKAQVLDLFLPPKSDKPAPLVIWVHGGAWLGGSKNQCPALFLLARGYAVASVGYRLSQVATFPAQIHDCKAAVRYLRAHAREHNIDPDRFGAWGSSAGGHLVALLGTSGDVPEMDGELGDDKSVSARVQAVVDWFGPTDLLQMGKGTPGVPNNMDHDSPNAPEAKLIGGPVQENKEKAAKANPITYVTKDDPPFLIMHGDRDNLVPINQSELLNDALTKVGVNVAYEVVKGAGHGFRNPEPRRRTTEFFEKHLKQKK
jgi:acetyl esterase/lipase